MNLYSKELVFAPTFGRFAAKWCVICGKTQCVLVQNAGQNAAKCKVKRCKTQC